MHEASVSFSYKTQVLYPNIGQALMVPIDDWNSYMSRIRNCNDYSSNYQSFGWACIGMAGSALLVALTFPFSVQFSTTLNGASSANVSAIITEVICTIGGIGAAVLGAITLIYAKQHSQDKADLRQIIIEDMQAFAVRCQRTPVATDSQMRLGFTTTVDAGGVYHAGNDVLNQFSA